MAAFDKYAKENGVWTRFPEDIFINTILERPIQRTQLDRKLSGFQRMPY